MTSRKREDIGTRKRQHWIALCGKLALAEVMGLSYERMRDDYDDDDDDEGKMTMTGPVRNFRTEEY